MIWAQLWGIGLRILGFRRLGDKNMNLSETNFKAIDFFECDVYQDPCRMLRIRCIDRVDAIIQDKENADNGVGAHRKGSNFHLCGKKCLGYKENLTLLRAGKIIMDVKKKRPKPLKFPKRGSESEETLSIMEIFKKVARESQEYVDENMRSDFKEIAEKEIDVKTIVKTEDVVEPIEKPSNVKTPKDCETDGCEGDVVAKGLCHKCYVRHRYRKEKGIPLNDPIMRGGRRSDFKNKTCIEDGCDDKAIALGMCDMHYKRNRRKNKRENKMGEDNNGFEGFEGLEEIFKKIGEESLYDDLSKIAFFETRPPMHQVAHFLKQGVKDWKNRLRGVPGDPPEEDRV